MNKILRLCAELKEEILRTLVDLCTPKELDLGGVVYEVLSHVRLSDQPKDAGNKDRGRLLEHQRSIPAVFRGKTFYFALEEGGVRGVRWSGQSDSWCEFIVTPWVGDDFGDGSDPSELYLRRKSA